MKIYPKAFQLSGKQIKKAGDYALKNATIVLVGTFAKKCTSEVIKNAEKMRRQ